jgi:hypothetical protein
MGGKVSEHVVLVEGFGCENIQSGLPCQERKNRVTERPMEPAGTAHSAALPPKIGLSALATVSGDVKGPRQTDFSPALPIADNRRIC